MDFPNAERVIYDKNPLVEVVCQFRFPRILALDERIPAEFQELLGPEYPFVETREVVQFNLGATSDISPSKRVHYDFITEDRAYTITLCSEFLAISTQSYTRWEYFLGHVTRSLQALTKTYSVPLFTRVGLRYVDVISKKALGLENAKWTELIRASALGLLAEDEVPLDDVLELSSGTALQLTEGGKATIRTTLGRMPNTGDEVVFVIDGDFFEEVPVKGEDDAIRVCARFNSATGRAFRWLIRDRLHDALGPRKPEIAS